MSSVHDQIITSTNNSAIYKAQQMLQSGASSNSTTVKSNQFLTLLTEQLKYQDPTNPTDSQDMLAQEAQFSALEQMEALQSGFSEFASVYKANSLVGQLVQVEGEDGAVSGKVDYIDYSDSSGAAVNIGGKNYPLSAVTKVYPDDEKNNNVTSKLDSLSDSVTKIAGSIENIAEKIAKYIID